MPRCGCGVTWQRLIGEMPTRSFGLFCVSASAEGTSQAAKRFGNKNFWRSILPSQAVGMRCAKDHPGSTHNETSIQLMKTSTNRLTETSNMFETENDLPKNAREELNTLMNQRLADAVDLQMQLKQAHWNMKGPSFIGLHKLFDKIAEEAESYVDMIA